MKIKFAFRQVLALILTMSLILPVSVFADGKADTKKAKKNFNEGLKYENEEKWDLATQSFYLAVAADTSNPEYRIHLLKASQSASQMFMKRGAEFEKDGDFASAYTAFKQATAYDQTNEIAPIKMKRMIELQKAQAGLGEAPKTNAIGNIIPTSADISPSQKYQSRSKDIASTIYFKDTSLKSVILSLSKQLGLNIMFDETFRDQPKYNLELQNTTHARALDFIFIQNKLTFEQMDRRTILIYLDNPNNRQRFERLMVKTFYVNNTKLEDARTAVQTLLQGGGSGLNRTVMQSAELNALIVRAPADDLRMIQEVLDSIDKNKAEVSIDVDIYEVSHNTSQQIGNQVATSPQTVLTPYLTTDRTTGKTVTAYREGTSASLANLGSFLGAGIAGVGSVLTGTTLTSGLGALLAAPPTTLSLLQSKTNAKLVSHLNVHALDRQSNKTNVGRRVPVNLGLSIPSYGLAGTTTGTGTGVGTGSLGSNGFGYSSFQYQDVGLNIDITPTITNEGYIEMKMTIESSNTIPGTGGQNQTPEFTQRKLTTISRVMDGKTALVAGVQQQNKQDSRSSIPVIGMVPFLGRLFTTPQETGDNSDIVITVTPHIIRAPQIEKKDHQAKESGTGLGGNGMSIEQVVLRAVEEDDQDRRIIAAQQGQPLAQPEQAIEAKAPVTQPIPAPTPVMQPQNTASTVQSPVNQEIKPIKITNNATPANNVAEATPENVVTNAKGEVEGEGVLVGPAEEYKPEIRPAVMSPEQKKAYNERAKTQENLYQNPPKVVSTPNDNPNIIVEPPGGLYTPKIVPVRPVKKDEKAPAPQSAQNEPKEQSLTTRPVLRQKQGTKEVIAVEATADQPIDLKLKLGDKKPQVGESFLVVLAVDSQTKMTGANIALNYDPTLLQLKAVRDGGILGKNPDLTQLDQNGHLVITMQQGAEQNAATEAKGKLLVLEFKAVSAGSASIAFNLDETRFVWGDKISPLTNVLPANFEIGRVAISSLSR